MIPSSLSILSKERAACLRKMLQEFSNSMARFSAIRLTLSAPEKIIITTTHSNLSVYMILPGLVVGGGVVNFG